MKHVICLLSTFVTLQSLLIERVDLFCQGSALVFLTLVSRGAMESRIDRQDLCKRCINSSVFKWVEEDSITGTIGLKNRVEGSRIDYTGASWAGSFDMGRGSSVSNKITLWSDMQMSCRAKLFRERPKEKTRSRV